MAIISFTSSVAILAAADKTVWLKCIGIADSDLPMNIVISGAGVATLNVAQDTDDTDTTKADKIAHETFTTTQAIVLTLPLPNFIQFENTGPSGTVTIGLGHGTQANSVASQPTPEGTSNV